MHTYKLKWKLDMEPGAFNAEDATPKDGLTDALFVASVMYPEDGSLSVQFMSLDGRHGGDMADGEWFKLWAMLAARLGDSTTLPPATRNFCNSVHANIRKTLAAVVESRKQTQKKEEESH